MFSFTSASIFRIFAEIEFCLTATIIVRCFCYEREDADRVDRVCSICLKSMRKCFDEEILFFYWTILPDIDQRILSLTNSQVVRRGYNWNKRKPINEIQLGKTKDEPIRESHRAIHWDSTNKRLLQQRWERVDLNRNLKNEKIKTTKEFLVCFFTSRFIVNPTVTGVNF